MTIFERIRNKASQAAQAVGNFIDRDKVTPGVQLWKDRDPNMAGNQIVPGGVQGGIQRVQQSFREDPGQYSFTRPVRDTLNELSRNIGNLDAGGYKLKDQIKAYPEAFMQNLPITPERQQNFNRNVEDILGKKSVPTTIAQGFNNWFSAPLMQVPYNIKEAVGGEDKSKLARVGHGAQALFGLLPGIDDAAFAGYNALKGAATERSKAGFQPGIAGNEYYGLGDAVTGGKDNLLSTGLNMAELPLLMIGGLKAKNLDEVLQANLKNAENLKGARNVDEILQGYVKPKGGNAADFIVSPRGTVSPVRELNAKATAEILDNVTPVKEVGGANGLGLPAGRQPLQLTAGTPREMTLAQIKKLAKNGDNMEMVKFTANKADDIREAVRLGVKPENIEIPNITKPSKSVLQFPQEEAALYKQPKTGVQGTPKSTLTKIWDDTVRSSKGVIADTEAGKRIKATLELADEQGAITGGTQADELMQSLNKLSKQEKATLADVIEGNAKPSSQAQAEAASVWKGIADDIYNRANEAGLDIGLTENYFPHHSIQGDKKTVNSILSRTSPRRYGNLELTRQTDLPYDKDPSVLLDYIYSANNRIAEAKNFGANDEVLYNLANATAKEGGDVAQVNKYLDQILGKNDRGTGDNISRAIRNVESFKLNPGTSVTNLTQNISTLLRTDPQSTAKSIFKAISNPSEAISNARKVGEIDANIARTLEDYAGNGSVVSKWLHAIGMLGAEKVNRVIAVNAGMEYTSKLLKQAQNGSEAAVRELKRLGFDNLDDVDALKGGRRISQETQFATNPGELPYNWHTSLGKVLTQFKSFAYKQTGFMKDQGKRIFQEFKAGNPKPLMNALTTYGVAAPIAGEIVNNVKSVIFNKERQDTDNFAERYFSNILAATSLGLFDSAGGLFGQYGTGGVISAIAGPAASDVYRIGETISGFSGDEYDRNKSVRNILNQVPGVGRTAANTFVPNSYVDNKNSGGVNLGVNEELSQKDKTTYQILKGSNPSEAEAFKKNAQAQREAKNKKPTLLSKIFGGGQATMPGANATATERKAFNDSINDALDNGAIPGKDELNYALFGGKSSTSESIEERTDVFKALNKASNNEYYTDEQKAAILEASGATPEDANYYNLASKDQDVRLQELLPKLDNMDEQAITTFLMQSRRAVGGKQLISNGMVDYLYEMDYINKQQKEAIKNLKYDEIGNKFYYSKSYTGSGSGSSLTYKQAKSLFKIELPKFSELKSVSSLLDNYSPATTSQTGSKGDRLLTEILSGTPKKKDTQSQGYWF